MWSRLLSCPSELSGLPLHPGSAALPGAFVTGAVAGVEAGAAVPSIFAPGAAVTAAPSPAASPD